METSPEHRLMADGRERLQAVHRREIEQEVRAGYAPLLEGASLFKRWRITLGIHAEVRQALARAAPAAGLY